jgi:hypothetical protein
VNVDEGQGPEFIEDNSDNQSHEEDDEDEEHN